LFCIEIPESLRHSKGTDVIIELDLTGLILKGGLKAVQEDLRAVGLVSRECCDYRKAQQ
jgi:hypothetical protein